jgi:hypothetical protein
MWGYNMGYDASRQTVVLYGAAYMDYGTGSTWEWDGTKWEKKASDRFFPYGYEPDFTPLRPMAFDTKHGRLRRLDFLGYNPRLAPLAIREWDGSAWNLVAEKGPTVWDHATTTIGLAYDAKTARMVVTDDWYGATYELADKKMTPAIIDPLDEHVVAGTPIATTLAGSGVGPLKYAVSPLPYGARLDAATGAFTWTPTPAQAGKHKLIASVSSPCGKSTRTFYVQVDAALDGLPPGDVDLAGTVPMEMQLVSSDNQSWYVGNQQLSCTVRGANPGPISVSCQGQSIKWTGLMGQGFSYSTPPPMSATLAADRSFMSNGFAGTLEPRGDGTYELKIAIYTYFTEGRAYRAKSKAQNLGTTANGTLAPAR